MLSNTAIRHSVFTVHLRCRSLSHLSLLQVNPAEDAVVPQCSSLQIVASPPHRSGLGQNDNAPSSLCTMEIIRRNSPPFPIT